MINGYSYTRAWFDFALENSRKIRPIHGILFLWAVEKCNRLSWVKEFQFPSDEACAACGCKDRETVNAALKDLQEWGFIQIVQESRNKYTAKYISLLLPIKTEAIPVSNIVGTEQLPIKTDGTEGAISAATPTNIKLLNKETLNLKQITPQGESFFVSGSFETKKPEEKTLPVSGGPLPKKVEEKDYLDDIIELWQQCFFDRRGDTYILIKEGLERRHAGLLLKIIKKENPGLNSALTLKFIENLFSKCLEIDNKWDFERMSLKHITDNYNKLKIICSGKSKNRRNSEPAKLASEKELASNPV